MPFLDLIEQALELATLGMDGAPSLEKGYIIPIAMEWFFTQLPLLTEELALWKQWLSDNVVGVLSSLDLGVVDVAIFSACVDHLMHDRLTIVLHEILHVYWP
jgi:hypothetical protein